jgi:aarF domain-containing kinase
VPHVHQAQSSKRVLTMEYVAGVPINDPDRIQAMGISLRAVSQVVARVFSELIFTFGDVHCDPHPANLLVRRHPQNGLMQLVLLDHGLYRCAPGCI